ncbi:MAG: tetratricopeptide repeat protein [bacterium]
MRKIHSCLFLFLFLLCLIFVPASLPAKETGKEELSATEQFYQANECYRKENYAEAASHYLELVRQGYRDPFLFYNLGNALFKKGNLGQAILFYEKARLLLPRDDDIRKNLAYANSLTIDKIEVKSFWLIPLWEKITYFLTLNELTLICTGIYLVLMGLLILFLRKKEADARKRLFHLVVFFSVMLVLAGGIFFYRLYELKSDRSGIIISKSVEVKSGPEENLATLFSLHEGTTFSIHQQRRNWLQIMLKNGLIGWLQSKDIEKITF